MRIKHIKWSLIVITVLAFVGFTAFSWVFSVPDKPQLISMSHDTERSDWYCHQAKQTEKSQQSQPSIDQNGDLHVLVWNIHKQLDDGWQQALTAYSLQSQLMLLQEASLTPELNRWVDDQVWGASYVNAFKVFDVSAGVLNLSASLPDNACAYTALEPWILLPKSALYAQYSLSNGQQLGVVNLHSINFTLGTKDFRSQITHLSEKVKQHVGPLIIAGDFNTWSETRTKEVRRLMINLGMHEARFAPDNRRRFINGLAFDHVFYRGLKLIKATSPQTTASDHNPMLAHFRLISAQ
ncbi:MAG: endonuclease/exonuclease/phosphatase family protein [Vibrio hibernica]